MYSETTFTQEEKYKKEKEALYQRIKEAQEKYKRAQDEITKKEANTERKMTVLALANLIYAFRRWNGHQEEQA